MIAALFLFTVVWFGLILDEEFGLSRGDLLVRVAAAIVIGSFWGAWILFLLALAFGFSQTLILCGTGLILGVNLFAWRRHGRNAAWLKSLPVADTTFWKAAVAPTVLITAYFAFCVWTSASGDIMFRGNSRDLAFHMGTVSAFVEQSAFPPFNPQSADARLSYHFMANFFAAILNKAGFSIFYALKIPMVLFAFSLSTLTTYFFYSVAKTRVAALFATILFFFGHIGVVNVAFGLAGYPSGNQPLSLTSWSSVEDHLTFPYYNFLNVIIDYFQPQLPFLFGFPLAMLVLVTLHRKFQERTPTDRTTHFLLGVIAFLPLLHMHTFLTLGPLLGLFVLCERAPERRSASPSEGFLGRWVNRVAIAVPPSPPGTVGDGNHSPHAFWKICALFLAALPVGIQLAFIFSQKKVSGFSGFDVATTLGPLPELPDALGLKRLWFWLRVAGPTLVLGLAGLIWWLRRNPDDTDSVRRGKTALITFLVITGFYFGVINVFRFTPNWGDSNKFFLYLNVLLCLGGGWLLDQLWHRSRPFKITVALVLLLGAILPTTVEWVMRCCRPPECLFRASDRMVADWIKLNTPPDAVFLTANSFVHLVPALAGRRVVNGSYTRETGYADSRIEELVTRAYREANTSLITQSRATHVMVGPEELGLYHINRASFARRHRLIYDQASQGVVYSIYEIREPSVEDARREKDHDNARSFLWLSELDPVSVNQSFDTLKYDRAINLDPLTLKGRHYTNGLGTHARSEIQFNLEGKYVRFESDIGLDDSQTGGIGSIQFEVWVDGKKAYQSKILHAGDDPETIRVDTTGASLLRLVVTDAGDGNHFDHADWADARLIKP